MAKIVMITSNIAPYRLRWCEELSKFYDVEIVYTKDHDYERDDRWLQNSSNSCSVTKLNNPNDKYDPICFDVIDVIKKNKDSLIVFDGYGPKTNLLGLLYCKFVGRTNYVNVDGYPTERKKSVIKEFIKKIVIGSICDGFFASSELTKKYLVSYGADSEKIAIHNFSSITKNEIIEKPISEKEKINYRRQLGIESDNKIVLGVGRFMALKRFEDLIEAVKKCESNCELYIVGGKPTKEYLEKVGNNKNIHFVDFVLPENMNVYYKACDLFVLPSETDVWGLVLNEAMANGLPVIASDSVVGAYSLIRDNGCIFKTYDVNELSKDIDYCLDDKNNKLMSNNSLKIIKDYTIEGMVERQKPFIVRYFKNNIL